MKFRVESIGDEKPTLLFEPENQAEIHQIDWIDRIFTTLGIASTLTATDGIKFFIHR